MVWQGIGSILSFLKGNTSESATDDILGKLQTVNDNCASKKESKIFSYYNYGLEALFYLVCWVIFLNFAVKTDQQAKQSFTGFEEVY